uniref:Protein kinase domain-containing protein n=1 Tax=Parastrongyloides trichosuri TaxID=131310 RepID=A0A0N4ZVD6_PARTI
MGCSKNKFLKENINIYKYNWISQIGCGSFSRVWRAQDKISKDIFAVKNMTFKYHDEDSQRILNELYVLGQVQNSRYVVDLSYYTIKKKQIFIFFNEFGYNLKKVLNLYKMCNVSLQIKDIRFMIGQLVMGISYCHSKGIIHRDIKPENVLVDKDFKLKICDFGSSFCRYKSFGKNKRYGVTTLAYEAPELELGFGLDDESQDVWSTGCVFYEMLTGDVLFRNIDPFIHQYNFIYRIVGLPEYEPLLLNKIKKCVSNSRNDLSISIENMCNFVPEAFELLLFFLNPNYSRRMNIKEAFTCKFFCNL